MKYYLMEDICVMCGAYVPEGEWVCSDCKTQARAEPAAEMQRVSAPWYKKAGLDFSHFKRSRSR